MLTNWCIKIRECDHIKVLERIEMAIIDFQTKRIKKNTIKYVEKMNSIFAFCPLCLFENL